MTPDDIANLRISVQQIAKTDFSTPKEMVAWMGAMQAQDYRMSKWAIGLRLPGSTDESIEQAIDRGEIIRTHVLRPTWHLVAAEDIRWMLALTAKQIMAASGAQRRAMELDDHLLGKTADIIGNALSGDRQLTRQELMVEIQKAGIIIDSHRAVHIMFDAELKAVVCNGSMRGSRLTYRLMDEFIPQDKVFTREEALYHLAQRYFTSHGPATVQDFQWWSGLPAGDARKGLEMIKKEMTSVKAEDKEYWMPMDSGILPQYTPSVYLLPAFDEFLVSYKDRTAALRPHEQRDVITINGIFKPTILVNGLVTGVWKRTIQKDTMLLEPDFFDPVRTLSSTDFSGALQKLSDFWEINTEFINHLS